MTENEQTKMQPRCLARVLVVKTSALGDVVHALPIAEAIHRQYPGTKIDWVAEKPITPLLHSQPFLRNIIPINTHHWRSHPLSHSTWHAIRSTLAFFRSHTYDLILDLQGNTKSALLTLIAYAPKKIGFALKSAPEWPNIFATNHRINPPPHQNIREDYLFLAQQAFPALTLSPTQTSLSSPTNPNVCLFPGSQWKNKQLPLPVLIPFLTKLSDHFSFSYDIFWGTPQEKETATTIHRQFPESSRVIDKLPLPALQEHIQQSPLVISMDSLPLHLAALTSTPTFSLFGPSSAAKYAPPGPSHGHFQGTCPYGETFPKRCPKLRTCPTAACLSSIDPTRLFEEFCLWYGH